MTDDQTIYLSPFRDIRPDGSLTDFYGPTAETFVQHHKRFRDWTYQPPRRERTKNATDHNTLKQYCRLPNGKLRPELPQSEIQAYRLIVEDKLSERAAAERLGCSRRTVRVAMQRLMAKALAPSG